LKAIESVLNSDSEGSENTDIKTHMLSLDKGISDHSENSFYSSGTAEDESSVDGRFSEQFGG